MQPSLRREDHHSQPTQVGPCSASASALEQRTLPAPPPHPHQAWPPIPGTGSAVRAAASLARISPDERVPESLGTARANCRLRSRASLAALASTYS